MITFSGFTLEQWLMLLVSGVLPMLVALVTRRMASSALKAVTLLFLTAVVGFTGELYDAVVNAAPFDFGTVAASWLLSFLVAVASHYGVLKPTGVTGSQGVIAKAVPGGIGSDDAGKHSVAAVVARLNAEGGAR